VTLLGRPGRRLQFLGAGDMQACKHGNDLETCPPRPRGQTTLGVWSAQYLIALAQGKPSRNVVAQKLFRSAKLVVWLS